MKGHDEQAYATDLAAIHDAGFGGLAEAAAGLLSARLAKRKSRNRLIVELGCGSGIQAALLTRGGYDVLGYDISPAMIELARRRAPLATFHCRPVLDAEIPPCRAVTAVGEVLNYLFDARASRADLRRLFRRVHSALEPGGVLLFDAAVVGRGGPGGRQRNYTEGEDWACLFTAEEDPQRMRLTRHITTFRRVGDAYRRNHEIHRLRLFEREELLSMLRTLGFRVRTLRGYGDVNFPPGLVGFVATKP